VGLEQQHILMRLIWLLIALLLAGGGYLYLNPDAARQFRNQLPTPEITRKPDRLYKWRNSAGEWQVTDAPPPAGISYERLDYRGDENVLPVPPGIQHRE
jgi:hypothetical protein